MIYNIYTANLICRFSRVGRAFLLRPNMVFFGLIMLSHLYNLIKGRLLVNSSIEKRVVDEALYMIETKKTLREIAKVFKISKSTVHKDLKEKLKNIDNHLFMEVKLILDEHIKIRHIRGGESTKKKYLKLTNNSVKK